MKIEIALSLSASLLTACAVEVIAPLPPNAQRVEAIAETQAVGSRGDAADDPAIWVNAKNPELSLVLGTDKSYGIEVYDLSGTRVQSIPAGRTNNIDLRYVSGNTHWSAIAAASNRTTNTVSLFAIDHSGQLTWLQESEIKTGLNEPYGLCLYKNVDGIQVFVNDTDGSYQQWLLEDVGLQTNSPTLKLSASLVREFTVSSQPEGCVADDEQGLLFLGVEAEGVKVVAADKDGSTQLNTLANVDGVILAADVEGMSLYKQGSGGYLLVSSQGNYSYSLYDRLPPHSYRGSFYVADNDARGVDGSQETDGLDVSSVLRTDEFPAGLVVVQDGFNTLPKTAQNFKYVSWQDIAAALSL
ncbi:MAG: 3-phytase [Pseudohongiellaceae bacterium]|jgi:3-phytase